MKTLIPILLIFTLFFGLVSCEKIADEIGGAVEITINTDMEAPLVVVPTETKGPSDTTFFHKTTTLDPNENADLADHLDNIESIEVTGITLKVTKVSQDDLVMYNGHFNFTDLVNNKTFDFDTDINTPIQVGTIIEIDNTHENWDVIVKAMEDLHAGQITAHGAINSDHFEITFVYAIGVKVKASM